MLFFDINVVCTNEQNLEKTAIYPMCEWKIMSKAEINFFIIKMSSIRVVSYRDPPLIFFDDFSFWDISFFFCLRLLLLAYSAYINVSNNDVVMHFRILWSFTKYTTPPPPPTVNIDDLTHSGKQRKKLFIPMAGLYSFYYANQCLLEKCRSMIHLIL